MGDDNVPKNKNNPNAAYTAGALANGASICRQFARILGGEIILSGDGSCSVMRARPELAATILGRPYGAMASFSFQSPDVRGLTLNTGEVPVRQREVNPFIDSLLDGDLLVTAVHNHWLFDRPRLMYVHFESVSDPLVFAQAVADAFDVLTGRADEDDD
jgi:hypothetical protein